MEPAAIPVEWLDAGNHPTAIAHGSDGTDSWISKQCGHFFSRISSVKSTLLAIPPYSSHYDLPPLSDPLPMLV